MNTEKVLNNEPNDLTDPISLLRNSLNQEIIDRDNFHKFYNQLKNLPMFYEVAKKREQQ